MDCASLSGSVSLPVIGKLRNLCAVTKPGSYERAQAGLPMIAELEEALDAVLYSISINSILMLGRLSNQNIPSSDRLRKQYCSFKSKIHTDPQFLRKVMDDLPKIVAKYNSSNMVDLVGDDEFLALLK